MDWNIVLQLEAGLPAEVVAQNWTDWDTVKDIFTAVAVPAALGVGWLLKRQDARRQEQAVAEATKATLAREMKIQADRVIVETKTTDARLHEIALEAAETASKTWKDIVEDLRDHQFPMMRALLAECERRDAANRERIDCLEAAMRASGIPLP